MREMPATPPAGDADDGWPPLLPLETEPEPPPFPAEILPPWLRRWVEDQAEALQVPADLPALLGLAVVAAGAARKYAVRVRDGWPEPLNLYAVVALPPGDRKSRCFAEAVAPVLAAERAAAEAARDRIAEAAATRRVLEARLRAAEVNAGRALLDFLRDEALAEAREMSRRLAAHRTPRVPKLVADDVTAEKLGQLLAEQGGRLLLASPEGGVFGVAAGRYADRPNLDVFLKAHAGDSLRVDRIAEDRAVVVDRPALTMALAVQPGVIAELSRTRQLLSHGFLARWAYAVPRSRVGGRVADPRPVPAAVRQGYEARVRAVWDLPGAAGDGPGWFGLSAAGDRAVNAFLDRLEPRLGPDGDLGALGGWGNKLAGLCLRLAGVLHVADGAAAGGPGAVIADGRVDAALRLGEDYLIAHAQRAFGLMAATKGVAAALRVLQWVRRGGRTEFRRWEAHKSLVSLALATPEALDAPLRLLVERHYLRVRLPPPRVGPGRPAEAWYEVNPAVHERGSGAWAGAG